MSARVDKAGLVDYTQYKISAGLDENIALIKNFFSDDDTMRIRPFGNAGDSAFRAFAVFFDGMVNASIIDEYIIAPVMQASLPKGGGLIEFISSSVTSGNEATVTGDVEKLIKSVMYGDTLLFADGCDQGLIINTKGFTTRGISEPDEDKSLVGPREGFTELMMTNISLLRRKLQTPEFKVKFRTIGTRSGTKACVCYLDGLVEKNILRELERRLDALFIDSALETNYISERIRDGKNSIFKTTGQTEKPDIAAAKLLEGRIAIILDGTPMVLTVPYLFIESFQAGDDYYLNFFYGSFGRLMRFLGFLLTVSVPAVYVALLGYHQEMIPSGLMLNLAAATRGVPFPVFVEVVGMLLVFDVLRETGLRMSNKIGSALSIVGALVLGQAAVEARFVSAPTVIIVAMTCITGLMLPKLKGSLLIIRILLLIACAVIGIYGYFLGMLAMFIHLQGLQSFGIDYCSQMFATRPELMSDIYVRMPFSKMRKWPVHMSSDPDREGKP